MSLPIHDQSGCDSLSILDFPEHLIHQEAAQSGQVPPSPVSPEDAETRSPHDSQHDIQSVTPSFQSGDDRPSTHEVSSAGAIDEKSIPTLNHQKSPLLRCWTLEVLSCFGSLLALAEGLPALFAFSTRYDSSEWFHSNSAVS
jgi:hypothetical protein